MPHRILIAEDNEGVGRLLVDAMRSPGALSESTAGNAAASSEARRLLPTSEFAASRPARRDNLLVCHVFRC